MKALPLTIIASVVLLGNACSLWPKKEPEMPAIDFLSTPTNAFQRDLQSAQQREVSAATRTATAHDAYEKLKKDFKEADDKTKPAMAVQLATAQGDYINAQEQHMESKRSLRLARDAYIYKLYVNKHPEAVEAVEAPALDITAEAGLPAAMATPAATGASPVEITAKPQTPAEEGTAEAGPTERFDGNFQ